MIASAPGTCDLCGFDYPEGDDVEFTTKQTLAHVSCLLEEEGLGGLGFDSYEDTDDV